MFVVALCVLLFERMLLPPSGQSHLPNCFFQNPQLIYHKWSSSIQLYVQSMFSSDISSLLQVLLFLIFSTAFLEMSWHCSLIAPVTTINSTLLVVCNNLITYTEESGHYKWDRFLCFTREHCSSCFTDREQGLEEANKETMAKPGLFSESFFVILIRGQSCLAGIPLVPWITTCLITK